MTAPILDFTDRQWNEAETTWDESPYRWDGAPVGAIRERFEWVHPDGTVYDLSADPRLKVHWGIEGRDMPPVTHTGDPIAGEHGERLRHTRFDPRDVTLPMTVLGRTREELRQLKRALMSALDPSQGQGSLRVYAPDGNARDLRCVLADGAQGRERLDDGGHTVQRFDLILRAFDPFWYDLEPQTPEVPLENPGVIENTGDMQVWPVWTIHGHADGGTSITQWNDAGTTRLRQFHISHHEMLGEGEFITVDMRPEKSTVTHSDGTNFWPQVSGDGIMWPLVPGETNVQVEQSIPLDGAGAEVSFHRRWLVA